MSGAVDSGAGLGAAYLYPEHLGKPAARVLQVAATLRALGQEGVEVHFLAGRFWGLRRVLNGLGLEGASGVVLEPVLMAQSGPGLAVPFSWHGLYHASALARLKRLAGQGIKTVLVRHLKLADYLLARQPKAGFKLIYEAHELFAQTAKEEGMDPASRAKLEEMEKRVLSLADRVVAISRPLARALEPLVGQSGPVAVAPSGVGEEFFRESGQAREPDLVAYAGGLGSWKGVDLLFKALAQAPGMRLEVLGGEPGSPDWQGLEKLARELGITDRLKMRPRAGQDEVRRLLSRAALAVWPGSAKQSISAKFTSPLKLFEYLASGCAVIAPNLPAAGWVLSHERDALLFEPDDPASLAQAMTRLKEDSQEAARLAEAGRELAQKYTWRARARVLKRVIGETAQTRGGRA